MNEFRSVSDRASHFLSSKYPRHTNFIASSKLELSLYNRSAAKSTVRQKKIEPAAHSTETKIKYDQAVKLAAHSFALGLSPLAVLAECSACNRTSPWHSSLPMRFRPASRLRGEADRAESCLHARRRSRRRGRGPRRSMRFFGSVQVSEPKRPAPPRRGTRGCWSR